MADKDEKWTLKYNSKDFPTFEKHLLTELTLDDRSNQHLLSDDYAEDKLPADPLRKLYNSLTNNQKPQWTTAVTRQNWRF